MVTDPSGAVVSNAAVKIVNKGTGESRETRTTATGSYSVSGLPPGTHDVFVASPGFQSARLADVSVESGRLATTNITLNVGATSETVEVVNEVPRITSREFLIGDAAEETGYGLYRYMVRFRGACVTPDSPRC